MAAEGARDPLRRLSSWAFLRLIYLLTVVLQNDCKALRFESHKPSWFQQIVWENRAQILNLSRQSLPVLVSGVPSGTWSVQEWSPSWLAEHSNSVLPVKVRSNPQGTDLQNIRFSPGCCIPEKMRITEFIERSEGEHLYFSGPLHALNLSKRDKIKTFQEDLTVGEVSLVDSQYCQDQGIANNSSMTVWMATKGVTTPCHIDDMHNYVVGIRGRKLVTLYPPSAWRFLSLYPKDSLLHRNVRRIVKATTTSQGEDSATFEIGPNDILYIPPLWFHQITSLDSIALTTNIWSPSGILNALHYLWQGDIAVDFSRFGFQESLPLVVFYLKEVTTQLFNFAREVISSQVCNDGRGPTCNEITQEGDVSSFLTDFVKFRHTQDYENDLKSGTTEEDRLLKQYRLQVQNESPSFYDTYVGDSDESGIHESFKAWCNIDHTLKKKEYHSNIQSAISKTMQNVKQAVLSLKHGDAHRFNVHLQGMFEIVVGNYIEDVSAQVVGRKRLVAFFENCLLK